jgi:DNA-binding transcriptional ArsR family regulator
MSHRATGWAWEQPLPCHPKMVLMVLADHHNSQSNQCNPRVKRIAEIAGLSESSTERALRVLQDQGLITIENNFREDGSKTSNTYLLNIPDTTWRHTDARGGVTQTPGSPPQTPHEPVIEPVTGTDISSIEEISTTHSPSRARAREPEFFKVLKELPGWRTPLADVLDYLKMHNISEERAEQVALELASKWGGPKWKHVHPYRSFQVWVKRPPLSAPARADEFSNRIERNRNGQARRGTRRLGPDTKRDTEEESGTGRVHGVDNLTREEHLARGDGWYKDHWVQEWIARLEFNAEELAEWEAGRSLDQLPSG